MPEKSTTIPRARSRELTTRIMSAVRSKNSKAELVVAKLLRAERIKFRRHSRKLPGTPDFAIDTAKLAIFVDGDFWHGRQLRRQGARLFARRFQESSQSYWLTKIRGNMVR